MSVQCSICGKVSQDHEFCDHCNSDLGKTAQNLPPERCPLGSDVLPLSREQRHLLLSPEAALLAQSDGRLQRIHWISSLDWRERGPQIEQRLAATLSCLPPGRVINDAQGHWLIYDSAPAAAPFWQQPRQPEPIAELQRLSAALHSIIRALDELHQQGLVWLNFNPHAIEDIGPARDSADWRSVRLTNLDIELFPCRAMPERVRVHPQYAAPEIVQYRIHDIGPRTDVFHLAAFAYYWLAGRLPDGLPGNGLESFDFALPPLRTFAPQLIEGIAPVVTRGLSLEANERHETPQAFAHAIDTAIVSAVRRRSFAGSLRWDTGSQTRTGQAKLELRRTNEDSTLIKVDDRSALVVVADGVSTCDVGSGGLASMMTTIMIENALGENCTHTSFPDLLTSATERGSIGLLEWALAHDCRADLEAGKDLMGTTLTVGWLSGRELSLGNLGDSRAYLITSDYIEQLTVDGDLASDLLAHGATPEEVRELGAMSRALRECVGGCVKTDDGHLDILRESCRPRISRWPLVPGDVLVLCTDGLVEEGYFLEPAAVGDIVRANMQRPASELALMLVEAADALQRVPSIIEPDGFGDNISCVVVKILE